MKWRSMSKKRRCPTQPGLVWHYTIELYYPSLLREGVIRVATAAVRETERPVVWFSTNQVWEPTASKPVVFLPDGSLGRANMQTTLEFGGLLRIGVAPETAPLTWARFVAESGVDRRIALGLVQVAKKQGADPAQWRASFEPVPRRLWRAVEIYRDGAWRSVAEQISELPEDLPP